MLYALMLAASIAAEDAATAWLALKREALTEAVREADAPRQVEAPEEAQPAEAADDPPDDPPYPRSCVFPKFILGKQGDTLLLWVRNSDDGAIERVYYKVATGDADNLVAAAIHEAPMGGYATIVQVTGFAPGTVVHVAASTTRSDWQCYRRTEF